MNEATLPFALILIAFALTDNAEQLWEDAKPLREAASKVLEDKNG